MVPLRYEEIGYYDPESKRTIVRGGTKLGYLDEYGQIAVPVQFEYAEVFTRGKARVLLNGRDIDIDVNGEEVPRN